VALDPSSNSSPPNHSASSPTITLSVDNLRESDRFAYWREEWCQATVGVTGELDQKAGRKFRARATSRISEHVIR